MVIYAQSTNRLYQGEGERQADRQTDIDRGKGRRAEGGGEGRDRDEETEREGLRAAVRKGVGRMISVCRHPLTRRPRRVNTDMKRTHARLTRTQIFNPIII